MKCPECKKEFSSSLENHQPRLLKCGHSFCFGCLKKLFEDDKKIQCRECRIITNEGHPSNLKLNYLALDLITQGKDIDSPDAKRRRGGSGGNGSSRGSSKNDNNGSSVELAIGIDLGNCYSRVGCVNNNMKILVNEYSDRKTPSYVSFRDPEPVVGTAALTHEPSATVFDIKRIIGRKFDDPVVRQFKRPFDVVSAQDKIEIVVANQNYSPERIAAYLLENAKRIATNYAGRTSSSYLTISAVLTVPAHFGREQRQAVLKAAELAHLPVLQVISEPQAIVCGYIAQTPQFAKDKFVVVDLGSGCNVAVVSNGRYCGFKHDPDLGGEFLDNQLVTFLVDKIQKHHGVNISGTPLLMRRLRNDWERAKRALALDGTTEVEIEVRKGKKIKTEIKRLDFEDRCDALAKSVGLLIGQALQDNNFSKNEIECVLLVGGCSRIPKMKEFLETSFQKLVTVPDNPDELVAYGAAVQAQKLVAYGAAVQAQKLVSSPSLETFL